MSKTKIVVFKLKELLLTLAFVLTGVVALMLLIVLFSSKKDAPGSDSTQTSALYYPGVYTSSVTVNDSTVLLELVCDNHHINSVRLVNMDEAVETMYPLLHPALSDLELQLVKDVPLEEIIFTDGSTYTQTLLMEAIERTLKKAWVQ